MPFLYWQYNLLLYTSSVVEGPHNKNPNTEMQLVG